LNFRPSSAVSSPWPFNPPALPGVVREHDGWHETRAPLPHRHCSPTLRGN